MNENCGYIPEYSLLIEKACHQSLKILLSSIVDIDLAIFSLADVLERAQPLINGRLVVKFSKHEKWFIDGKYEYVYFPVVGKMVKFVSGRWRFVQLDKVDRYEKLSDLRVGKAEDSDALVRKIIDEIEELLSRRKIITDQLHSIRSLNSSLSKSVEARTLEIQNMLPKLRKKIKIDWKENADEAIKTRKEKMRLRYQKRKDRLHVKTHAMKKE